MMRKISKEELDTILENHKHWLNQDVNGWETMRADLRSAELYGVDLCGADLSFTNLCNADLRNADLRGVILREAKLYDAELYGVDLRGASLDGANLCNADLCRAFLDGASLRRADLSNAKLCQASLRGAYLNGAELYKADFRGASLNGAIFNGANLYKTNISNFIYPISCPDVNSFTGWKKASALDDNDGNIPVIVKLLIPNTAERSSATGRKCRCNEAIVLDIQSLDGESLPKETIAHSHHDSTFTYEIGKTVKVDDFDKNRWNECSTGIHFFITRQEAVDYMI